MTCSLKQLQQTEKTEQNTCKVSTKIQRWSLRDIRLATRLIVATWTPLPGSRDLLTQRTVPHVILRHSSRLQKFRGTLAKLDAFSPFGTAASVLYVLPRGIPNFRHAEEAQVATCVANSVLHRRWLRFGGSLSVQSASPC